MNLMIVAGEASGERHGADLIQAIRACSPSIKLKFFGSGGPAMREAGAETLVDVSDVSIIGPVEIALGWNKLLRAYRTLRDAALHRRPAAVILIDWPEFNLRLVKALKRAGIRTIYYISPQLWAWRRGRIRIVKRYVDRMLVILPFEVDFYRDHGVEVSFVGHPLLDTVRPSLDRTAFFDKYQLRPEIPLVSLLPGSRQSEIGQILPPLTRAAELAAARHQVQYLIPLASTISRSSAERMLERLRRDSGALSLKLAEHDTWNALAHSTLAVVASGTATLEAALLETPLIVVYRGLEINWRLIRPLIHLDTFSLVNLIAGRTIVPELIQHDLTPEKLAEEMLTLLRDPARRLSMTEDLKAVRTRLGEGNAARRAATEILQFLGQT
ncbi:MAG: lipid-A-disaccharide synthase [Acidobacteria bacterium]|nr:lipid-A-disaccharide synthase [Acidobacteriota bacterium]